MLRNALTLALKRQQNSSLSARLAIANYASTVPAKSSSISIKTKLMRQREEMPTEGGNKITVVGAGFVGMSCAICILSKNITNEICIIDKNEKRLTGEMFDLQHGSMFLNNASIIAGNDYCLSADSKVCIIAAGMTAPTAGDRLTLAKANVDIIKEIIPKIVKYSPDCIVVMLSSPVDITTYVAKKVSGFAMNRVFGSGTALDTARFRYFLSERLNIAQASCHGLVIGEKGNTSVPVWSSVNVAGTRLRDLDPCVGIEQDPDGLNEIHEQVVHAGKDIISKKGYTNWGIGLTCAYITEAIVKNVGTVMPVSVNVKGLYSIKKDVCVSVPCVINSQGASAIVRQNLTDLEIEQLQASANSVRKTLTAIKA